MPRIAVWLILLAAVATFGAICYLQDEDDGEDTGLVFPTLPAIGVDLREALPSTAAVDAAFGAQEGTYSKGNPFGFISDPARGRPGVNDQLAAGLVGAYWTVYAPGIEPGPGEENMVVSIAAYEDESAAENALLLGPDVFRSTISFVECVEDGGFERADGAGAWSATCEFGQVEAVQIRHERFVLTIVSSSAVPKGTQPRDFPPGFVSATESVAASIDFDSITSP